jgi:hypothetical protein
LGFNWEANDFFYFVADMAEQSDELQIMYGIGGEHELTEQSSTIWTVMRGLGRCGWETRHITSASTMCGGCPRFHLVAHSVT